MMSTSSYSRSADTTGSVHAAGLRCFPYGLQDVSDLSSFIDGPYDLRPSFSHSAAIDPQLLLLNNPPVLRVVDTTHLVCHSQVSFDSSHSFGWPQEPYFGEFTMADMAMPNLTESMLDIGGEGAIAQAARSCSPASDASMLSDGGSFSCASSMGAQSPGPSTSPVSGPSGSYGQLLPSLSSAVGPARRGRGRPRKDAPPVYQPPPVCMYVDPVTNAVCGKRLNRHHDLPRHMVKHCQDEAALVNSGRLPRERATLLPADWQHTDELKLPCRFCSLTFSRSDAVTRHERREHKHRPRKG